MRIISYGKDPATGTDYKIKCNNCRTVFEFHSGEAITRPDPRDGDYYEVQCPVCKRLCTQAIKRISYG